MEGGDGAKEVLSDPLLDVHAEEDGGRGERTGEKEGRVQQLSL